MSQINSRKRKGDHLDHPHQMNRGYLSINMLNNHHSIPNNSVVTSEANHYHQSAQHIHHPNAAHSLFQMQMETQNHHHVPNKLLILNSSTNSSSCGSMADESSMSEFGASIDNITEVNVNLQNNNNNSQQQQRKQRHETSLGQLTKKFVGLLQDKQGELNLNDASSILQVQKRRIYDITNVLEGVGLLSKTFKNKIKWVGAPFNNQLSSNSTITLENQQQQQQQQQHEKQPLSLNNFNKIIQNTRSEEGKISLKKELDTLDAKEKEIDRKIRSALNDLNSLTENDENKQYAFLTYLDIKSINEFSNQTVIAIKAPSETKLELADPREKLQMFLKSDKGEIEVYICPDEQAQSNSCDLKSQDDQGKGESITSEMDTQHKQQGQKNVDHLKYAFISEDDDLGPMGNRNLLMQTDDQANQLKPNTNFNATPTSTNLSNSPCSSMNDITFLYLQPPLSEDDYNFALEDSEGIVDLFDEMLPEY